MINKDPPHYFDQNGRKHWIIPDAEYQELRAMAALGCNPGQQKILTAAEPSWLSSQPKEHPGVQIRARRIEKGMKQVDVAKALGMTPANLCNIEKGQTMPEEVTVSRLMNYLK